jgi:hypothetical protein
MERKTRDWLRLAVVAIACALGFGMAACKKERPSHAPRDIADDIDAIEAELSRKDAELSAAGIVVVARRDVAFGRPAPESPAAPPPAEGEAPVSGETPEAPAEAPAEPTTEPGADEEADMAQPTDAPRASAERRTVVGKGDARAAKREKRRAKKSASDRCGRICALAQATCDLRDRVCGLAAAHEDDMRYQSACARAEDQCTAASEVCESCAA